MQENSSQRITLKGYADVTGSENKNLTLSEKRANTVKEYLLYQGIDPLKIKTEAVGSSTTLSTNTSEKERTKNRRVEISR